MPRHVARTSSFRRLRLVACFVAAFVATATLGVGATATPTSPSGSGSATTAPGNSPSPGKKQQRATFGIGPATLSAQNPRGYFSYQMGAGGSYRDRALVVNYGSTPLRLTVYAADLANSSSGALAVGLQNDVERDAGGWVRLPHRVMSVPVRAATARRPGTALIPVTIEVPGDASPGDHGAALVAVLSTLGKNPKGENVRLDQRVATRIYVRVNGPLMPKLAIEGLRASYHQNVNPIGDGRVTVHYVVRNTGNVRLGASQLVAITGMFGTKRTVVAPKIGLLFPHGAQLVDVTINGVFPTVWQKAHVAVTPLLFQDQKPVPVTEATQKVSFFAVPWVLLGCVVLLLLVIAAVIFWLRRLRRRRPPVRNSPDDPIGSGDGRRRGRGGTESPSDQATTETTHITEHAQP